ncbi:hypothetical protein FJY71_07065 [candidate division WOR-3 bacterium]|nr:hypothetical protein [candidate division WOR-3 bacterium]
MQVVEGIFNVILGSLTAISSLPEAGNCSLEVIVGTEPMVPKIPLVAVPYAYHADNTARLQGRAVSDAAPGTNQVLAWNGSHISANDNSSVRAYDAGQGYGPYSSTSTGNAYGVYGYSGAAWGVGGYGASNIGVYGYGSNQGVYGYATGGDGVYGDGPVAGGYFYNRRAGVYTCGAYSSYGLLSNGTKSCVIATTQGDRAMYCPEAPEVLFEDVGSAQLVDGYCRVDLDPLLLEGCTIDEEHPLRVYVTMNDECGTFRVVKHGTCFEVLENQGGQSNATFDWRIVASRKGFEDKRLERVELASLKVPSLQEPPPSRPDETQPDPARSVPPPPAPTQQ